MKNDIEDKIDFVITWVDSGDEKWLEDKRKYKDTNINNINNVRYRDWDNLRYWFRGIEKNAPWVNNIFFITYGHLPNWLNLNHPKLKIVNHSDYIPNEYLPTFNSRVLEIYMHRINELSENFVYFNDDMFLIDRVKPKDFFKDGIPCDSLVLNAIVGDYKGISNVVCNDIAVINKYFDKKIFLKECWKKIFNLKYGKENLRTIALLPWKHFTGFLDLHVGISFNKSTFDELWRKEEEMLLDVAKCRFREEKGVNLWLFRYWQLVTGKFYPRRINFSKYYLLSNDNRKIIDEILKKKNKMICLNDNANIENYETEKNRIKEMFEALFPDKSSFEN